mgnify:CR=1 FL=1
MKQLKLKEGDLCAVATCRTVVTSRTGRLGRARAQPLRLLRARLAALGSSALPGKGPNY